MDNPVDSQIVSSSIGQRSKTPLFLLVSMIFIVLSGVSVYLGFNQQGDVPQSTFSEISPQDDKQFATYVSPLGDFEFSFPSDTLEVRDDGWGVLDQRTPYVQFDEADQEADQDYFDGLLQAIHVAPATPGPYSYTDTYLTIWTYENPQKLSYEVWLSQNFFDPFASVSDMPEGVEGFSFDLVKSILVGLDESYAYEWTDIEGVDNVAILTSIEDKMYVFSVLKEVFDTSEFKTTLASFMFYDELDLPEAVDGALAQEAHPFVVGSNIRYQLPTDLGDLIVSQKKTSFGSIWRVFTPEQTEYARVVVESLGGTDVDRESLELVKEAAVGLPGFVSFAGREAQPYEKHMVLTDTERISIYEFFVLGNEHNAFEWFAFPTKSDTSSFGQIAK